MRPCENLNDLSSTIRERRLRGVAVRTLRRGKTHLDELIDCHTHAKCKIMCDHHTEESYIGECWSHVKRNQVLEEPLRVDACIQSSKLFHTKGLCAPWTMKSFQGPVKSQDHFGLHQGQNARVTMEFEIPKRHILRLTLFIDMVQRIFAVGEAKEAL